MLAVSDRVLEIRARLAAGERRADLAREFGVSYNRIAHIANPSRHHAHQAVYDALKAGKLTRLPCKICRSPKVQAHHANGYAPAHRLDVVWLCTVCHAMTHTRLRDAA
jgi:hypothetical protein